MDPLTSTMLKEELELRLTLMKDSLESYETTVATVVSPTENLRRVQRKHHLSIAELEEVICCLSSQLIQLGELVRLTALMTSTLDINLVLNDVLDTIIQLTGAERAYLMLCNDQRKLEICAARDWDQESITEAEASFSYTVVRQALTEGRPVLTTNALLDDRFMQQASVLDHQIRSVICIPLKVADRIAGALYADNRSQSGIFTSEFIPVLTAFGTQAAIAITNAHIHSHVERNLKAYKRTFQKLHIQIDRSKVEEEVTQITGSAYFQDLAMRMKEARQHNQEC